MVLIAGKKKQRHCAARDEADCEAVIASNAKQSYIKHKLVIC